MEPRSDSKFHVSRYFAAEPIPPDLELPIAKTVAAHV